MNKSEKEKFFNLLRDFVASLTNVIVHDNNWTMRGFAEKAGYIIEPAEKQNWYPDFTFISSKNKNIKFAVDLKTTYRDEKHPEFCNGFTLGSHGEYFTERNSSKNIQYPYSQYSGHFCIGIIYSRNELSSYDSKIYDITEAFLIL